MVLHLDTAKEPSLRHFFFVSFVKKPKLVDWTRELFVENKPSPAVLYWTRNFQDLLRNQLDQKGH